LFVALFRSGSQNDSTPLQLKLNHLAEVIAKLGLSAGLLLFFCLMIRYFTELNEPGRTAADKAQNFISILIIAVTVIVVAVPEGLPLAVTLALAFATRRMTAENLLVRVLASCETMANTTVVCTDKTGTLTQNKMSVVAGSVGVHLKFADRLAENKSRANANDDMDAEVEHPPESPVVTRRRGRMDFSMDMAEIDKAVNGPVRRLFNEAVAVNSTAFEGEDEKGNMGFIGSKTETALLAFTKNQGWKDYKEVRNETGIVQVFPFSSERKCSGVVVRVPGMKGVRMHVKGASELLERLSTQHIHVANPNSKSFSEADAAVAEREDAPVKVVDFTEETKLNVERSIIFYANQSLRTIALCYRDFPVWPPPGVTLSDNGEVEDFAQINKDLTLLAITAIEDPLRPGVTQAVKECQDAGVQVKMCTGDNVLTARSIATQCGIFTPGGLIMEGPHFRTLSDAELVEVLPRLQILARSSPQDKERLVAHLRADPLREVVGVTGDGMNDACVCVREAFNR
jgi:Ca2+-transporting ATPase